MSRLPSTPSIVVICLLVLILGVVGVRKMPVDMFPSVKIRWWQWRRFLRILRNRLKRYHLSLQRMFTLAVESATSSLAVATGSEADQGVLHPDTDADADAAAISTLAMADLKNLPPGVSPIVLKPIPSLPVCLVTLRGADLSKRLKDLGQNFVRNQLASVSGASVPSRSADAAADHAVCDPLKLEAHQLSDGRGSLDQRGEYHPARWGCAGRRYACNIYTNALLGGPKESIVPLKMVGNRRCGPAISAWRKIPLRCSTTSCGWTGSGRLPAHLQARRRSKHRLHRRRLAGQDHKTL